MMERKHLSFYIVVTITQYILPKESAVLTFLGVNVTWEVDTKHNMNLTLDIYIVVVHVQCKYINGAMLTRFKLVMGKMVLSFSPCLPSITPSSISPMA